MAQTEHKIREYLLGQLSAADEEQVELRLLTEPDFAEEYDLVVNEVTDDYIAGRFEADELKRIEEYFFKSTQRRDKLRFALALNAPGVKKLKAEMDAKRDQKRRFRRYLQIAAALVLLAGGSFYLWRVSSNNSDLNKGLAALQSAFRDERPLEARISTFNYAPYPTTRGTGPDRIDQDELRRAELILLTLKNNPTPAVHYGLGKVHLAKKEFDQAIQEFDEALKGDPKNAQIYSDLGAAWLEKGKIDIEKAKSDAAGMTAGKGMEELARSLENLNKALELNPNLLEALFNRALCRQSMKFQEQAGDDWREYLKRDSTSRWAEEARRKLQLLEDRNQTTSRSKDQILNDFLTAFDTKNDEAAWEAISGSRERKGNLIVQGLLDDYLNLAASGRTNEAARKLEMLSYEGEIEEQKAQDRFTSDLVRFYKQATPGQRALSLQAREVAKSANALYYKVEFEQALALYSKARELFISAKNECETLVAESWAGYCSLRIPRVQESLKTFEHLSELFRDKSYRSLCAQSLNALSDAELSRNEFSKAAGYATRSLELSREINDKVNAVRSFGQIVSVQLNVGSYTESLNSMSQGLSFAETSAYDPTLLWHFYYEAALDYYHERLFSAAFDSEREAERLADISHNSLLKARSLDRLALLYEQAHDYEQAVTLLNQALNEAQSISGESSRAVTQVHTTLSLGQLYREMGNLPQAVDYYDRTLDLSRKLDNLEFYLYQAHKGKLLALIGLHEDAAAEMELTTVVSLFEDYRDKIVEETYRNKFFDVGQNTYDVAVDFEYSKQANFEKAFQYAEAYRARSLFELMTISSRGADQTDSPNSLMSGTKPLTASEIRSSMSEHVQLLEYSVLEDKVILWVVTKNGLEQAEAKITATELDEKIRQYRKVLLRNRESDNQELTSLAKDLYAKLISPVESRGFLDVNRQLCIAPDKSLNSLPFAALISPSSGQYLIESYAIQVVPSATIFVMSSRNASLREAGRTEHLLSVGDPRFDQTAFADLPSLPAAKREAQQITTYYKPADSLMEDEATPTRVKQALPGADVAHFATHAVLDEDSPLLSKLLLARERSTGPTAHHSSPSFLQASEIYNLKLPHTRLVVLSACQTGIEQAYRGEGAIGLARPFIAAGVPIVVASLWPVDSATTADLMISFHKHRKQDRISTVEALRRAQLDMLRSIHQGFREPYAWAAFVPIGGYAKF